MNAEDRVLITFDPTTGKLEFSSPKDLLAQASETAQLLIKTAHACLLPRNSAAFIAGDQEKLVKPPRDVVQAPERQSTKANKKPSDSAGRAGRIGSFEKVDFKLSDDQERAIYEFYQIRRPAEQDQQVAVAMFVGEKVLGREAFEYNDIYSLLHLGGERDLPKALDVVIGRMKNQNWVTKSGSGFALKFLARDFVEKQTIAQS